MPLVTRAAAGALAVGLLAAGCGHGSKRVRLETCAKARAAAAARTLPSVLRGDVDGDGVPDRVALVRLRRGNSRCGAALVVRTRGGVITRAFPTVFEPPVPSLNGLASLSPRPGLQIVVTTWEGASTAFATVFAVRDGRISELSNGTPDETFPYEGSVTHIDAVDCVRGRPGLIVASGWFERGPSGRNFGFVRRFYRVGENRFALVRTQGGPSRSPFPLRNRFREFREPQPFPSCMAVRVSGAS